MIDPAYARTMARYNRWQNGQLYACAETLEAADRMADRGLFFGSIQATLSHLLWADRMWLHRLAGMPAPPPGIAGSTTLYPDWDGLARERRAVDEVIEDWAAGLDPAGLSGTLTWYSGATGRELSRPRWLVVMHLFNHQTHHRGQVHAALTGLGVKTGVTDLAFMPGLE